MSLSSGDMIKTHTACIETLYLKYILKFILITYYIFIKCNYCFYNVVTLHSKQGSRRGLLLIIIIILGNTIFFTSAVRKIEIKEIKSYKSCTSNSEELLLLSRCIIQTDVHYDINKYRGQYLIKQFPYTQ